MSELDPQAEMSNNQLLVHVISVGLAAKAM